MTTQTISLYELKRVGMPESHVWWRQFEGLLRDNGYLLFNFDNSHLHTIATPPMGEERGLDPVCCKVDGFPARRRFSVMTTRGRPVQHMNNGRWMWIEAVALQRKGHEPEGLRFLEILQHLKFLASPCGSIDGGEFFPNVDQACTDMHCLKGLAYLHEKGIAHRDLGAENILANLNGVSNDAWNPKTRLFFIEFEFADCSPVVTGFPCEGYTRPSAPEVGRPVSHNPQAADVWQLGRLLRETLTTLPCAPEEYAEMADLCESMTYPDPRGRPSAQDVLDKIRALQKNSAGT
ncbi:hypothetical protein DACRYDRAFT_109177 [Dacryopinax primogenitus]|uniref:Protein kinase domain-containing protein n=1 Tax=Dacryopinax primogenitus (strain DJM 731) TaxID=1858805 RepID=M5FXE9_DACPD|nr:uncharacterized protein DACRYDRAFT_109177 [Dacryopinax primogenitus]EJU00460.1 hypothetical protein DACRYDRAFT_109177 [Dacryopinax primogenitus]